MINFMLPGLYEHYELNLRFLALKKNHPEYFREDANIGAVYGNFQFCTWDGGRIFMDYKQASKEKIEFIQHQLNNTYEIPLRLIYTNNQITEKDLYDRFNNLTLQICDNPLNEVVVSSPLLESYIREKYPNYKIISSTTKCLNSESAIEEIKKDYFLICLDYNLNKNWDFLNNIPSEERNKIEFLINAICPSGCKTRKQHYLLNGLFNLSHGKKYQFSDCKINSSTLDPRLEKGNNLTLEEIYNKYPSENFTHFKIEGRSLTETENACNYVKFMVKPEYQLFVLNKLFN